VCCPVQPVVLFPTEVGSLEYAGAKVAGIP
jgi:hypothetical protein